MEQNELIELFKYYTPHSILIITWYCKLKFLYCPFYVRVKKNIGILKKDEIKKVSLVKLSSSGKTIFIIENQAYFYNHFDILLKSV